MSFVRIRHFAMFFHVMLISSSVRETVTIFLRYLIRPVTSKNAKYSASLCIYTLESDIFHESWIAGESVFSILRSKPKRINLRTRWQNLIAPVLEIVYFRDLFFRNVVPKCPDSHIRVRILLVWDPFESNTNP